MDNQLDRKKSIDGMVNGEWPCISIVLFQSTNHSERFQVIFCQLMKPAVTSLFLLCTLENETKSPCDPSSQVMVLLWT